MYLLAKPQATEKSRARHKIDDYDIGSQCTVSRQSICRLFAMEILNVDGKAASDRQHAQQTSNEEWKIQVHVRLRAHARLDGVRDYSYERNDNRTMKDTCNEI